MRNQMLLTRKQAAEALGVATATVARLIASGELGMVRIGRSVLVPRGDVLALIERGTARTTDRTSTHPGDRA